MEKAFYYATTAESGYRLSMPPPVLLLPPPLLLLLMMIKMLMLQLLVLPLLVLIISMAWDIFVPTSKVMLYSIIVLPSVVVTRF